MADDPIEVQPRRSARLRAELSARNLLLSAELPHATTPALTPSIVYEEADGIHGNFFPASYRRILARPEWRRRLDKVYTASRHLPRAGERRRGELECANSSDALLMNVFCHAPVLRSPRMQALLHLSGPNEPGFGVRTRVPLRGGHDDRTEVDMQIGDLLVEAKLSEGGFGSGRPDLMARYQTFQSVFDLGLLSHDKGGFRSYQLLRGALAADFLACRFALVCDARRPDLVEDWFAVLRAIRAADLRSRMVLVTWQEIAACVPRTLQAFLLAKYGIEPNRR